MSLKTCPERGRRTRDAPSFAKGYRGQGTRRGGLVLRNPKGEGGFPLYPRRWRVSSRMHPLFCLPREIISFYLSGAIIGQPALLGSDKRAAFLEHIGQVQPGWHFPVSSLCPDKPSRSPQASFSPRNLYSQPPSRSLPSLSQQAFMPCLSPHSPLIGPQKRCIVIT